jgi:hypothetical protein
LLRVVTSAGVGIAVTALFLAPASSASPKGPAPGAAPRTAHPAYARRARFRRPAGSPTTCSTSNATSFVGIDGLSDVAGEGSAVPGGMDNEACDFYGVIAAGTGNGIGNSGEADESFIGAGNSNGITGDEAFIGAGQANSVAGQSGFVGAGIYNAGQANGVFVGSGGLSYFEAQQDNNNLDPPPGNVASADDSFVGAGDLNQISGPGSFIGAGGYTYAKTFATTAGNQIAGTDAFIGAGDQNKVAANGAFVGAGQGNSIAAQATYAALAGGYANSITGEYGAIAGGSANSITGEYGAIAGGIGGKAAGTGAAIGGGETNLASGAVATIPGGYHNVASGIASFAAGYGAEAVTNGAFVWADESSTARVKSAFNNEFVARASGGVYFYSNAASTAGVRLPAGGGAWSSLSDRNMKTGVAALDDAAVLDKVAALPVNVWSYTSEPGVRHVGPMAQDFYAAFGVGEDDRHITSIDEDGVALAAIKALHAENRDLRDCLARNSARLARVEALAARDEALRARDDGRLLALERKVSALAVR